MKPIVRNESAINRSTTRDTLKDCIFLSFAIALSVIQYVYSLGFYSDDWVFFSNFRRLDSIPFLSFLQTIVVQDEWARIRPVQLLYLGTLYRAFGLNPLGYHLVNTVVFTAAIIFFYLVLRRLNQSRLVAVVLPLVYAMLPHYSTDRFWIAAFQANLSVCFYFINFYALLRALDSRSLFKWKWMLLSIISVFASSLAYEVAMPLFALSLLIILYRTRKVDTTVKDKEQVKIAMLFVSNIVALILVVAFKALVSQRTGKFSISSYVLWIMSIIKQATIMNYVYYGLFLPHVAWNATYYYTNRLSIMLATILGGTVFLYLYYLNRYSGIKLPNTTEWVKLFALSFIVFGSGYAIFATNTEVGFHKTGITNRTAVAAAIGVAMTFVSSVGLLSSLMSNESIRKQFFSLAVVLLCMCGFLINNAIGAFWVSAFQRQQEVLAGIQEHFPAPPAGSTIILDGVCPYVGPGIVFDNQWDLRAALRLTYGDSTLEADIVRPNLKIEEQGISTSSYEQWKAFHPFSEKLFLYHFGQRNIYRLTNAETARRYFETSNPGYDNGCPPGREGVGVAIF